jgi:hypothetical protein
VPAAFCFVNETPLLQPISRMASEGLSRAAQGPRGAGNDTQIARKPHLNSRAPPLGQESCEHRFALCQVVEFQMVGAILRLRTRS